MNKDIKRNLLASSEPGEKIGLPEKKTQGHSHFDRNSAEDALIEAIDQRDFLTKHAEWVTKLQEGKLDVQSALQDLSPDMVIQLAFMAFSKDVSSKTRLTAIQDWLDRAGYSKVQKIAAAMVDPNAPKEQLISLIASLGKKNKVIEVTDEEDQKE